MSYLTDSAQIWLMVSTMDGIRYILGVSVVAIFVYGWAWLKGLRRIQDKPVTFQQCRRELLYSLSTVAMYGLVGIFTVGLANAGYLKFYREVADYGWTWTLLSIILLPIVHDTYFYWIHRFMHQPGIFKYSHRVHHQSIAPTVLAAYSFAPLEAIFMALFVPVTTIWFPVHVNVMFGYLAFMIIRNAMGHSGIEFHWKKWVDSPLDVLTTVVHHDLHHQKGHTNYALYFTWWDRLMGTETRDYKAIFREVKARQQESELKEPQPQPGA